MHLLFMSDKWAETVVKDYNENEKKSDEIPKALDNPKKVPSTDKLVPSQNPTISAQTTMK